MLKRKTTTHHHDFVFNKIKNIIIYIYDYRCCVCGLEKPNLHVHHLDHNHQNNDPLNLLPLCSNCHKLAHKGFEFKRPAKNVFLVWHLAKLKKYIEFLEN